QGAELQRMLADIRRDQHYAHGEHDEPPIVDAHGNSIDARHQDLSFEKASKVHGTQARRVKGKGQRVRRLLFSSSSHARQLALSSSYLAHAMLIECCHSISNSGTGCSRFLTL